MEKTRYFCQLLTERRVRIYQDGYKEQVFTMDELEKALEAEKNFVRLLALAEAKISLSLAMEIEVGA